MCPQQQLGKLVMILQTCLLVWSCVPWLCITNPPSPLLMSVLMFLSWTTTQSVFMCFSCLPATSACALPQTRRNGAPLVFFSTPSECAFCCNLFIVNKLCSFSNYLLSTSLGPTKNYQFTSRNKICAHKSFYLRLPWEQYKAAFTSNLKLKDGSITLHTSDILTFLHRFTVFFICWIHQHCWTNVFYVFNMYVCMYVLRDSQKKLWIFSLIWSQLNK